MDNANEPTVQLANISASEKLNPVTYLISTYRNNLSVSNLLKLVKHEYSAEFVLVCWSIGNGFWFIPAVYDANLYENTSDNKSIGWYMNEEPNKNNLPFQHSKLQFVSEIKNPKAKILFCTMVPIRDIKPDKPNLYIDPTSRLSGNTPGGTPQISAQHTIYTPSSSKVPTSDVIISRRIDNTSTLLVSLAQDQPTNQTSLPKPLSNSPKNSDSSPIAHREGYGPIDLIFMFETMIDKLAMTDNLARQKFRQELILQNISQSIRSPLNDILRTTTNIIDLSKNYESTDVSFISLVNALNKSSVSLADNIFDILDMNKLELGKLTLYRAVFCVRELLSSCLDLINSRNKSTEIVISSYVDDSVPEYIYSDEKRIKQILVTLLENALQHTKKGEIILYVHSSIVNLASEDAEREQSLIENKHNLYTSNFQHLINFDISDTGQGVDPRIKDLLFKPIELHTSKKHFGISLRMSHLLARHLGGDLKLLKTEINKGSSFEFSLVACDEEPPKYISNTIRQLKDKNILVLDTTLEKAKVCNILDKYHIRYAYVQSYEEIAIMHLDKSYDLLIYKFNEFSELIYKSILNVMNVAILGIGPGKHPVDYQIQDLDNLLLKAKLVEIFSKTIVHNKIKILVVDLDQVNRLVTEKMLRMLNYTNIILASSYEEAAKKLDVDLIILDLSDEKAYSLIDLAHDTNICLIGVSEQLVYRDIHVDILYKPVDFKELDKKIKHLTKL